MLARTQNRANGWFIERRPDVDLLLVFNDNSSTYLQDFIYLAYYIHFQNKQTSSNILTVIYNAFIRTHNEHNNHVDCFGRGLKNSFHERNKYDVPE